jgi:hypothetical protein
MALELIDVARGAINWGKDSSGYVASALVLATFCAQSMQWLRVTAIASNVAFVSYAMIADLRPVFILHCILLPVNIFRLSQLYRARMAAKRLLAKPELEARGPELARPQFLSDECLADPGTALGLVEREQERVAELLPACLPSEAATASGIDTEVANNAVTRLLDEIDRFLAILQTKYPSNEELRHISNLQSRDETLRSAHVALGELNQLMLNAAEGRPHELAIVLSEALAGLLLYTGDAARTREAPDIDLLFKMTDDRSGLVENIRQRSIASMADGNVVDPRPIYAITALYERIVWHLHRYAALLRNRTGVCLIA